MRQPLLVNPIEESVLTILFSKDRSEILLVKRADVNLYVLPGGAIDPGETKEKAAVRETLEETGLQVRIKRYVMTYLPSGLLTRKTHFYECEVVSGELTPSFESIDVAFFPLNDLPKTLVPFYHELINDALDETKGPGNKPFPNPRIIKNLLLHPVHSLKYLFSRLKNRPR